VQPLVKWVEDCRFWWDFVLLSVLRPKGGKYIEGKIMTKPDKKIELLMEQKNTNYEHN